MSITHIDLYDEETETEVPVCIEYSMNPADEEVGIFSAFGELEYVSMWIPAFGSITFNLAGDFQDDVNQAIDDQVWESS